jgi:hypothetical protein
MYSIKQYTRLLTKFFEDTGGLLIQLLRIGKAETHAKARTHSHTHTQPATLHSYHPMNNKIDAGMIMLILCMQHDD